MRPHAKGLAVKGEERVQLVEWEDCWTALYEWMLNNAVKTEEYDGTWWSATFSVTGENLKRLKKDADDFVDQEPWDPKKYHYFWYHDSNPGKLDRFIFLARKYIEKGYTIEYVSFW